MKYILSRYNHNIDWLGDYSDDWIMYDRSTPPLEDERVIKTANMGTDIRDKFTFIIDNYDNLPEVAVYTKANIFKYISQAEFDQMRHNQTFTPILTSKHRTYLPTCYYQDGLYYEINNFWYLGSHAPKNQDSVNELVDLLKMRGRTYNGFAPGSNYILTKADILRHPKSFYEKLRTFLEWAIYPGEAHIIERNLYYLWGTNLLCQK